MLNAQSAKAYFFSEFAINVCELKNSWQQLGSNFFGKIKIDVNLVVKSKVPPCSGSAALDSWNPSIKRGHKVFLI